MSVEEIRRTMREATVEITKLRAEKAELLEACKVASAVLRRWAQHVKLVKLLETVIAKAEERTK